MATQYNTHYCIAADAITITPNMMGSPDYVLTQIYAGAVIRVNWPEAAEYIATEYPALSPDIRQQVTDDARTMLGYAADGVSDRRWLLDGKHTKLALSSVPYNIYARLSPDGTALLVYSPEEEKHIELVTDEDDGSILGDIRYVWVKMGTLSAPSVIDGVPQPDRVVELDTGNRGTTRGTYEGAGSDWYNRSELTHTLDFSGLWHWGTFVADVVRPTILRLLGRHKVHGEVVWYDETGVLVSTDAVTDNETTSSDKDKTLVTSGWIFGPLLTWLRGKFVNKDTETTQVMKGGLQATNLTASDKVQTSYAEVARTMTVVGKAELKGEVQFGQNALVRDIAGGGVYEDEDHNITAEFDNLRVHKKFHAEEVEIMETNYIGGKVVNTMANGFTVTKVEKLDSKGEVTQSIIPYYYRLYFKRDDGDTAVKNTWKPGDFAYCERWDVKEGTQTDFGNHLWWRRVMDNVPNRGIGVNDDYITVSGLVCLNGSDTPEVGDKVVMLGSALTGRQAAIIQSSEGNGYFKFYNGINTFSLSGKEVITISPDGIEAKSDHVSFSGESKTILDMMNDTQAAHDAADAAQQTANAATRTAEQAVETVTNIALDKTLSKNEIGDLNVTMSQIEADVDRLRTVTKQYRDMGYNDLNVAMDFICLHSSNADNHHTLRFCIPGIGVQEDNPNVNFVQEEGTGYYIDWNYGIIKLSSYNEMHESYDRLKIYVNSIIYAAENSQDGYTIDKVEFVQRFKAYYNDVAAWEKALVALQDRVQEQLAADAKTFAAKNVTDRILAMIADRKLTLAEIAILPDMIKQMEGDHAQIERAMEQIPDGDGLYKDIYNEYVAAYERIVNWLATMSERTSEVSLGASFVDPSSQDGMPARCSNYLNARTVLLTSHAGYFNEQNAFITKLGNFFEYSDGDIKVREESGLLTTATESELYAKRVEDGEIVSKAAMGVAIEEGVSKAIISADQIDLTGETTVRGLLRNGVVVIDEDPDAPSQYCKVEDYNPFLNGSGNVYRDNFEQGVFLKLNKIGGFTEIKSYVGDSQTSDNYLNIVLPSYDAGGQIHREAQGLASNDWMKGLLTNLYHPWYIKKNNKTQGPTDYEIAHWQTDDDEYIKYVNKLKAQMLHDAREWIGTEILIHTRCALRIFGGREYTGDAAVYDGVNLEWEKPIEVDSTGNSMFVSLKCVSSNFYEDADGDYRHNDYVEWQVRISEGSVPLDSDGYTEDYVNGTKRFDTEVYFTD